jgi:hypothetical protein
MQRLLIALIVIILLPIVNKDKGKPEPIQREIHFTEQHQQYIKDSINQTSLSTAQIYLQLTPLEKDIMGITIPLAKDKYLILISPKYPDQEHTVQHELIHVKQMHRGQLSKHHNTWYWQGEQIDWQEPYEWRPWEQLAELEAFMYKFEYQLAKDSAHQIGR